MQWIYIENLGDFKSIAYGRWKEVSKDNANALIPSHCIYSDYSGCSVEAANCRYIQEKVPDCIEIYGGYGTRGVAIPVELLTEELMEEIEALDDYPVFDEELLSQIENERESEAMPDICYDFKRLVIKKVPLTVREEESLDAMDITNLIYRLMQDTNTYFQHETGGGVYVDSDDLIKKFNPKTDIKLLKRGVSRKVQRRKAKASAITRNKAYKQQYRRAQGKRRLVGIPFRTIRPHRVPKWNEVTNL